MDDNQTNHQKSKKIAAFLAFLGALQPTPVPFAGMHKFYLGQYGWGIVYILLGATLVPRIASTAEGIWCLVGPKLKALWVRTSAPSLSPTPPNLEQTVEAVAESLRKIEHLRQEGLLSDHEFEQKRRSLLEQIP